jgi:hypothetical protein
MRSDASNLIAIFLQVSMEAQSSYLPTISWGPLENLGDLDRALRDFTSWREQTNYSVGEMIDWLELKGLKPGLRPENGTCSAYGSIRVSSAFSSDNYCLFA